MRVNKRRKVHPPNLNAKLDRIVLTLVEAVDYDHAKNLVEATAEEPETVGELRSRLRGVLYKALAAESLLSSCSGNSTVEKK